MIRNIFKHHFSLLWIWDKDKIPLLRGARRAGWKTEKFGESQALIQNYQNNIFKSRLHPQSKGLG